MNTPVLRRQFLHASSRLLAGASVGLVLAPSLLAQTAPAAAPAQPPGLPADRVEATVRHAHGDLDRVRALVDETPTLVNACWDWGNGDFETPLQAAAHMGRRDIAEYLLSRRARLDIFAAAMLGQLEFVQAAFAVDPQTHAIPGPHGFTLLHCALKGGEAGQRVADWMHARGVPDITHQPLAGAFARS